MKVELESLILLECIFCRGPGWMFIHVSYFSDLGSLVEPNSLTRHETRHEVKTTENNHNM